MPPKTSKQSKVRAAKPKSARSAPNPAPKPGKARAKRPAAEPPPRGRKPRSGPASSAKPKARPPAVPPHPSPASARTDQSRRATTAGNASELGRLADLRRPSDPPPKPGEQRGAGLRGAAPWVARHAAKHAAELRARNAEPAPPGSARATLRVPVEAERIKARVAQLHQQTTRIRGLCRRLDKNFYEVGQLLADIQRDELHIAKGYASFEAFLDRELEIGRAQALRLVRIAHTFLREMAYDYGLDRLTQALAALDGELSAASPSQPSNRSFSSPGLPARPPIRFAE